MGKVIAVCISEKKGTQKHPVEEAEFVEDWGIKNDAHAFTICPIPCASIEFNNASLSCSKASSS